MTGMRIDAANTVNVVAGETIAAGAVVMIATSGGTLGRAYKFVAGSSPAGPYLALTGGNAGDGIVIQVTGLVQGLAGLTAGSSYYASLASAGTLTTNLGVLVGVAVTTTTLLLNSGVMNPIPSGAEMDWPGDTAPQGWVLEDGTAYSRTGYSALFAVCGTKYGVGDGSTTFNVPDARGRFRLHKATSGTGNTLGATGGSINHTHTYTDVITHTHTVPNYVLHDGGIGSDSPEGASAGSWSLNENTSAPSGAVSTGTTAANNPPYIVSNAIIKL